MARLPGPRTEAVLRSALLALVQTRTTNGSAYTLAELPAFLTHPTFRRGIVSQPHVPPAVRDFWRWFDGLSRAEQTQVVGPVMNKLSALTQRTPLRLLLGQSGALNCRGPSPTARSW